MRFQEKQHFSQGRSHFKHWPQLRFLQMVFTAVVEGSARTGISGGSKVQEEKKRRGEEKNLQAAEIELWKRSRGRSRSYTCNACGSEGRALGFNCAHCEFDLHVKCASLHNTILLDKHPHELKLIFDSPYENKNTIFACDLCRGIMQNNFWLYHCADYDFTAHLDCAVSKACFKEDKSRKPEENTKAKVLGNKKPEEQNAAAKDSGKENSNLQYKDLKDQIQELKISISELRKQKEQQMVQKLEKDSGK
ncbi:Hypothetical predicted protein [Olea europaea subsp. europaea]|uniref:DC1 domain-containing protein n=1 Tax=Olea europaea subsp. europaea TaxID=158383 RepID=A0A8S0UER8_OLEEU|nr:Hypothetical predicted protein [Olea europaea subsp. europaea]